MVFSSDSLATLPLHVLITAPLLRLQKDGAPPFPAFVTLSESCRSLWEAHEAGCVPLHWRNRQQDSPPLVMVVMPVHPRPSTAQHPLLVSSTARIDEVAADRGFVSPCSVCSPMCVRAPLVCPRS